MCRLLSRTIGPRDAATELSPEPQQIFLNSELASLTLSGANTDFAAPVLGSNIAKLCTNSCSGRATLIR
eukprot:XP_001708806.1 Hypothetical protein GL50803_33554 [Giardia lamblia ATCC 50803]